MPYFTHVVYQLDFSVVEPKIGINLKGKILKKTMGVDHVAQGYYNASQTYGWVIHEFKLHVLGTKLGMNWKNCVLRQGQGVPTFSVSYLEEVFISELS